MAYAWGELALARGEPTLALQVTEQLLESAPGVDRAQPIPGLLKLKGEALASLNRLDDARQALEEARRGAQERQARHLLWRIHRSLGRLYQRLEREAEAERELVAARAVIESLAATIDEPGLTENFRRAAAGFLV